MKQTLSDEVFDTLPKKPNFLLVVGLAGAAILVFFLAAYLLLSHEGKKLIPGLRHSSRPNAYLRQPDSQQPGSDALRV